MQGSEKLPIQSLPCALCGTNNPATTEYCSACGAAFGDEGYRGTPGALVNTLPAGCRLLGGQYILSEVLGQGGFGITYRAHDTGLNRAVAIKEFFPTGCTRAGFTVRPARAAEAPAYQSAKLRFSDEARTLARFRHPGIVDVYAVFEENHTAYMVMELLTGQTLQQLLEERGALPEKEAVELITKAGEALAVVHENGLLHRDLKPGNLLRRGDGHVVLIDFGTAREFAPDNTRHMTTTVTPGYAPLEQYGQQARFGAFTDIYALGATLYHLVTGRIPVQAPDRASGVELAQPRELNAKLSTTVNDAILWALQIGIKQRPQSVPEFLEGLLHESREPVLSPAKLDVPARQDAPAKQSAPVNRRPRSLALPPLNPKFNLLPPAGYNAIAQEQIRRERHVNGRRYLERQQNASVNPTAASGPRIAVPALVIFWLGVLLLVILTLVAFLQFPFCF